LAVACWPKAVSDGRDVRGRNSTATAAAGGVDAWWLLPVAVATILWVSLRRETSI